MKFLKRMTVSFYPVDLYNLNKCSIRLLSSSSSRIVVSTPKIKNYVVEFWFEVLRIESL